MVNENAVLAAGVTRVHRDYWLNNILYDKDTKEMSVIDWENAGIGSPYEDFAIVNLWIERVYENTKALWMGYGSLPDKKTVDAYLLAKCVEFLSVVPVDDFTQEIKQGQGFFLNKIRIIQEILSQYENTR